MKFSIRHKIIFFFSLASLLVFSALGAYIGFAVRPRTMTQTRFAISQMVESKANEVSMWVKRMAVEYRTIAAIPAFSSMDVREITPLIDRFTELYKKNGETMETFSYIGKNGFCWINSSAVENLMDHTDYQQAYQNDREFILSLPVTNPEHRQVMLFYYPILGSTGIKEALICAAIPTVRLKEIVNPVQIYEGRSWVMTRNKDLITTDEEYFVENVLSRPTLDELDMRSITSSDQFRVRDAQGKQATLFVSPVTEYDDWVFCTLVQDSVIGRSTHQILIGVLILFCVLLLINIVMGASLVQWVLKPIRALQGRMKKVEEGTLDAYYTLPGTHDEIDSLGQSYNAMLDEIISLIDKIYQEQAEKRQAELKVLQAQIKPHFLYNTLDNLKWMAKAQGADEVAKAITSLSTYFRIFLSNGQEKITLAQEFKHTEAYLTMQKIRYGQKLNSTLELAEDARDLPMLKILIQPLVENAINHGLKPKENGGTIQVSARLIEDRLEIQVRDDGVGMDEATLAALREALQKGEIGMIRALVGDDEENIRNGLIRQIESLDLGIQVVAAAENGRQVMEYYEKMTPDLLILDINMPLMSGLECIEQIRAQDPDCVILILSGYDHFSYAQKAIQHHVDFYLLKPVEDEELEDALRQSAVRFQQRMEQRKLIRQAKEAEPEPASLIRYLYEHFTDPDLNAEKLQEKFSISHSTLFKLVKTATGKTLVELITDLRMELAQKLLAQKELPVKEIAGRCGYSDQFYFSRIFKKQTGLSPKEYRAEVLKGEPE